MILLFAFLFSFSVVSHCISTPTTSLASKCSNKLNPVKFCAYWFPDRFGSQASAALYEYLADHPEVKEAGVHGVWGIPPTNVSHSCGTKEEFASYFCDAVKPLNISLFDPSTNVLDYTDCQRDPQNPLNYQFPAHAYHECKCHASKYNVPRETWLAEWINCYNILGTKPLYYLRCRFDKKLQCNWAQDVADYPYMPSQCKSGYPICNELFVDPKYYTVPVNSNCTAKCYKTKSPVQAPFFDINDRAVDTTVIPEQISTSPITPTNSTTTGDKIKSYVNKMSPEYIALVVVLVIFFLILVIIMITLCCFCSNGKIRRTAAPRDPITGETVVVYRTIRRYRSLVGLQVMADAQNDFLTSPKPVSSTFVIGASNCSPEKLFDTFNNISPTIKTHTDSKDNYLSWELKNTGCVNFARCWGTRTKLRFPVSSSCVKSKLGMIRRLNKINVIIYDSDYTQVRNIPLFSPTQSQKLDSNRTELKSPVLMLNSAGMPYSL